MRLIALLTFLVAPGAPKTEVRPHAAVLKLSAHVFHQHMVMRTLKTSAVRWFFVTSAVSGFYRRVARYLFLRDRRFRCNKLRLQEIISPNIEKTIHKQRNARIARVTHRSARAHSFRGRIHEEASSRENTSVTDRRLWTISLRLQGSAFDRRSSHRLK